jgi:signal transduction histidine kinase
MHGSSDPVIVSLSVLAAILAVYVALDLTGRIAASSGAARSAWIVVGAFVTGAGMWTMHFTGMLAERFPIAVTYSVRTVLVALVIAAVAPIPTLRVAATGEPLGLSALAAGCVLGIGMGAMHVVAMSAMRMAATPVFDVRMILLSIVIAIVSSIALVSVASRFRSDEGRSSRRQELGASVVIGLFIAGMHYTAMAGTTFRAAPSPVAAPSGELLATRAVAYTVVAGFSLMGLLALASAAVDRALRRRVRVANEYARLRDEAELARDQAQAANKAKSGFLAAMSHELRTPLNAIAGYTQILQLGVHGPLTDKQQDDLARIERSEKHLLGLINDVLNYARLEGGGMSVSAERVSADSLMTAVEEVITPQLQSRDLRYARHRDGDDLTLYCDPEKAEQVLVNILWNAVKFTPDGGMIELHSCAVDGVARISVRDSGVGIPEDKLESIFEPFVQIERKLSSPVEGAGLGLAISRELARAMGGELRVRSKVGKGSVFTLELPLATAGADPSLRSG